MENSSWRRVFLVLLLLVFQIRKYVLREHVSVFEIPYKSIIIIWVSVLIQLKLSSETL